MGVDETDTIHTFIIANTIANRFGTKSNFTAKFHPNRQR